jgi:protein-S-isoprenylcysteine O-methyltransferase Ste14
MPAVFTVPQNPLITSLSGGRLRGLGCMGCAGMGDVSSTMSADSLGLGLPNWAYLAGAGVLVWVLLMPGGSEYRKKRSALRSQYRGYKRVREAASEALA